MYAVARNKIGVDNWDVMDMGKTWKAICGSVWSRSGAIKYLGVWLATDGTN